MKKKQTCPWYLIIIFWNQKDVEIVLSRQRQSIVDYASKFDDNDEFDQPKPINTALSKDLSIRTIPHAGYERGPTRSSLIRRFSKLIPNSCINNLTITKI